MSEWIMVVAIVFFMYGVGSRLQVGRKVHLARFRALSRHDQGDPAEMASREEWDDMGRLS